MKEVPGITPRRRRDEGRRSIPEMSSPPPTATPGEIDMLQRDITKLRLELERERDRNSIIISTIQTAVLALPKVKPFEPVRRPSSMLIPGS